MDNTPEEFRRKEDGSLVGIFLIEEERPVEESAAKAHYDKLVDRYNKLNTEISKLEEEQEDLELEIGIFGDVFKTEESEESEESESVI